jgi:hypothetical protein
VVLWTFENVELHEIQSRTSYVGGSQGVSIRITRGVYYRTGAFKGHRVQTQEMVQQDVGSMPVTNQNVYFAGQLKSMRIRLSKIVTVRGYSDGIAITREAANPKPLFFAVNDPWFASNLILKLGAVPLIRSSQVIVRPGRWGWLSMISAPRQHRPEAWSRGCCEVST